VKRFFDGYCRLLDMVIALFLAIMVVLVFGNVVLRYAFNSGISVSEEVSRWLFVWLTFLGAIVAHEGARPPGQRHARVAPAHLGKKVCLIAGHLLMLYITWLLFQGSLQQAQINSTSRRRSPALDGDLLPPAVRRRPAVALRDVARSPASQRGRTRDGQGSEEQASSRRCRPSWPREPKRRHRHPREQA
jgi:TRAP-type C4-dicarboxylate transport system permease small subunit